jgi:hypothetical protein
MELTQGIGFARTKAPQQFLRTLALLFQVEAEWRDVA